MRVRLDKWLWAARFFKTRSLAKAAIDGGKIHYDGQRTKVSREVQVGEIYQIRQGNDEKMVRVLALSDIRGPASVAQTLYEETPESVTKREALREARRLAPVLAPEHRPDKRDRRKLMQFKQGF